MSNVLRFPGVQLPPPPADDQELRREIRARMAAVVTIMATSPSDDDIARAIYQIRKTMVAVECIRVLRALP